MSSKAAFLRQVPLFADLPAEELKRCAALANERTYPKGSVIFHADDPSSVLFVLKAGAVKIALMGPDGDETIVKVLRPPEFFGEMSLLDGQFHSATITAVARSTALILHRETFIQLIRQYPDFAFKVMKALSARLRATNAWIIRVVFSDCHRKVAGALVELAKEKGEPVPQGCRIPLRLSRHDLAAYMGVSRMTLHRVLKDLVSAHCISIESRGITILDHDLLAGK